MHERNGVYQQFKHRSGPGDHGDCVSGMRSGESDAPGPERIQTTTPPVVAGFSGGALGIAATFLMEDFTAKDPLTAVAVGIVSGLAATGAHQIYKQLTKAEEVGYEGKHQAEEPKT